MEVRPAQIDPDVNLGIRVLVGVLRLERNLLFFPNMNGPVLAGGGQARAASSSSDTLDIVHSPAQNLGAYFRCNSGVPSRFSFRASGSRRT